MSENPQPEQNPEQNPDNQDPKVNAIDSIEQMGVSQMPQQATSPIHCLSIIGQIEGHVLLPPQNKTTKYEHLIPQLIAIEENPQIKGFIVLMNTVGGDVEAGLAIAEMIASMSKPSVSVVLGGGHSIGVPLATCTNYSYITSTATMTVHPVRINGMIISVPQSYEYFDRMQDRVIDFICRHSHISREKLTQLMMCTGELANDVGTVLLGQEAVEAGIIDAVGGLSDARKTLWELIEQGEKGESTCSTPSDPSTK